MSPLIALVRCLLALALWALALPGHAASDTFRSHSYAWETAATTVSSASESVLLRPALVLPSGGAAGVLSNAGLAGTAFSAGAATVSNLDYGQVGIITLTPSLASGSHLGTGAVSGSINGNIGRLVPARFADSSCSANQRSGFGCSPASSFSHLGENFGVGLTLTAQNLAGETTANDAGSFGITLIDSDGVAMAAFDLATTSGGAKDHAAMVPVNLRFGHLRLSSAIGAADRALGLLVVSQHRTGTFFDVNTLDNCTQVPISALSFGNLRRTLTTADTTATVPVTLAARLGSLRLAAPGGGRSGTCDKDPTARVSFGLQRTQDNLVYRRENL